MSLQRDVLQVIAARKSRDAQALASLLAAIDDSLPPGAALPADVSADVLSLPLPGMRPRAEASRRRAVCRVTCVLQSCVSA